MEMVPSISLFVGDIPLLGRGENRRKTKRREGERIGGLIKGYEPAVTWNI